MQNFVARSVKHPGLPSSDGISYSGGFFEKAFLMVSSLDTFVAKQKPRDKNSLQGVLVLNAGYTFGTPEALRLIAFSNAQAANLSSQEFPACTMHRACKLQVQKLPNGLMIPNESQLATLKRYWGPARALILEEFTMCPAEGCNMGLLRSAQGRSNPCGRNADEYLIKATSGAASRS